MSSKSNIDNIKKMKIIAQAYITANKIAISGNKVEDSKQSVSDNSLFIKKVKKAFSTLQRDEKELINKDYFYQDFPYWWHEYYSQATYYRLRNKATNNFLRAYDED